MRARRSLALIAVLVCGCGIEHRSASYGRAYRESMAMQEKPPATPPAAANMSLDTQEADVITGSYLRSLAAKGRQDAPTDPVIYVAPAQRQGTVQQLSPSVPKN